MSNSVAKHCKILHTIICMLTLPLLFTFQHNKVGTDFTAHVCMTANVAFALWYICELHLPSGCGVVQYVD